VVTHAFALALSNLAFRRGRAVTLVVALGLVIALPAALNVVLERASRSLAARAEATPLVAGTEGSELDLTVASLWFVPPAPREFAAGKLARLGGDGLATAIPLHLGQSLQREALVGTTLDYLDFRGLSLAAGRPFATLGECLLGAAAARRLGLKPGDSAMTDAGDPHDLAASPPIRLEIVGVLAPTGTPDDDAAFVDVKTAWTVAGLGHGHDDPSGEDVDPADLIGKVGERTVASERLRQDDRVDPANPERFHFHGDPATFPIHAAIVVPRDDRSAAILRGRFTGSDEPLTLVRPARAIERLLREILRVRTLLNATLLVVAVATAAIAALVLVLSIRMRDEEFATLGALGAARGTVAAMVAAEIAIVLGLALGLALLLTALAAALAPQVDRWIVG
jgi:putative ABC transport system permease protein